MRAGPGAWLRIVGLAVALLAGPGCDAEGGEAASSDDVESESEIAAPDIGLDAPGSDDTGGSGELTANRLDELDYLVVTTEGLAAAFAPLVEWKRRLGYAAQLVTTADIDMAVAGRDRPERIREYLRQAYETRGLRWVLLGGDAGIVPVREIHATADVPAEDTFVDEDVASDLYYADLDGNWDGDGDGVLGEPEDGLDGVPDVYLGRLPVDAPQQVAIYLDKLVAWETASHADYQDHVLFLGEWAGYGPGGGSVYSSAGFELMLRPQIPDDIELTRLYEDYGDYPGALPNTAETQVAHMARGQALVLDFGHGAVDTLCRLSGDEILDLPDTDRPSVYWTTECYSGMFDAVGEPCGGELFLRAPGGGVAYVGNSDFGVGMPSLLNLYSEMLGRLYGGEPSRMGPLLAESMASYTTANRMAVAADPDRFTNLTLLLLGDPAVRLWDGAITPSDVSVQHEGRSLEVAVTTGGAPHEGVLVAIYEPGVFLGTERTDAVGTARFHLPETVPTSACTLVVQPARGPAVVVSRESW